MVSLLVAAALGVVVGAGFELFETLSDAVRDLVWVDLIGEEPGSLATIATATIGGLAVGVALLLVPGHGGPHPAEPHELIGGSSGETHRLSTVAGTLIVGFVTLVAGASLGPEGALIPAVIGLAAIASRWARVPPAFAPTITGAALAALLAAMFGSPLAGAVPLLEVTPVSGAGLVVVILPALTASATAALTLQVLDVQAAGFLTLGFEGFQRGDIIWAVLIGIAAGSLGIAFVKLLEWLRRLAMRAEGIHLLLATVAGGFVVGVLYAIAGDDIRFSGVPELQFLIASTETAGVALLAVAAKLVATAVCLSVGYRGGKIFPLTFAGGALGLAVHLMWNGIPLAVAVTAGLAGTIAVGVEAPVVAALISAAVVGPAMLPLAIVAIVSAYSVFLLSAQLAELAPAAATHASDQPTSES